MNIQSNKDIKASVYKLAETKANEFNLKVFIVIFVVAVLSLILTFLDVFPIDDLTMSIAMGINILLVLAPFAIYLVHDKIRKITPSVLEAHYFKYLIIGITFVGMTIFVVLLSFHAVLLLVIPMLIASQYKNNKKLVIWVFIITLLMVPIGVYGSYFFGHTDRNFYKGLLTDVEAQILANRVQLIADNPYRLVELFTHYALPRLLCIVCIDALIIGITSRNYILIESQADLSQQVADDMEKVNKMQESVIEDLAAVIETRDVDTGEHVIRTKYYVSIIAQLLKETPKYKDVLTDEAIEEIQNAAPLHDIGKIAISDTILLKPGKLTPEEFDIMKTHTTKGGEMVKTIFKNFDDDTFLKEAFNIAAGHHEKWNGKGYPKGLKGEEIPLSARIMAVADVYDALVSKRVYKDPSAPEDAIDLIISERGEHFDPDIIDVIKANRDLFIKIAKEPVDLSLIK